MRDPHHRLLPDVAGDQKTTKQTDLVVGTPLRAERKKKGLKGTSLKENERERGEAASHTETRKAKNKDVDKGKAIKQEKLCWERKLRMRDPVCRQKVENAIDEQIEGMALNVKFAIEKSKRIREEMQKMTDIFVAQQNDGELKDTAREITTCTGEKEEGDGTYTTDGGFFGENCGFLSWIKNGNNGVQTETRTRANESGDGGGIEGQSKFRGREMGNSLGGNVCDGLNEKGDEKFEGNDLWKKNDKGWGLNECERNEIRKNMTEMESFIWRPPWFKWRNKLSLNWRGCGNIIWKIVQERKRMKKRRLGFALERDKRKPPWEHWSRKRKKHKHIQTIENKRKI